VVKRYLERTLCFLIRGSVTALSWRHWRKQWRLLGWLVSGARFYPELEEYEKQDCHPLYCNFGHCSDCNNNNNNNNNNMCWDLEFRKREFIDYPDNFSCWLEIQFHLHSDSWRVIDLRSIPGRGRHFNLLYYIDIGFRVHTQHTVHLIPVIKQPWPNIDFFSYCHVLEMMVIYPPRHLCTVMALCLDKNDEFWVSSGFYDSLMFVEVWLGTADWLESSSFQCLLLLRVADNGQREVCVVL